MNLELLRIWSERRQTIIFVTHSINEAVFLSDRIVVMDTLPGRVLSVVEVPLARPRSIEVMKSPDFARTAFEVRELLGWRDEGCRPALAAQLHRAARDLGNRGARRP